MTGDRNPYSSLQRFDGATVWATLTPEQQAEIGAIALEYAVSANYRFSIPGIAIETPENRPFLTAEPMLFEELLDAIHDATVELTPEFWDEDLPPPIPSRLGPVCRACVCSKFDPCIEGCACGWAEPDLCTACADIASAAPKTQPETVNGR